jgi:hypothetical protein
LRLAQSRAPGMDELLEGFTIVEAGAQAWARAPRGA